MSSPRMRALSPYMYKQGKADQVPCGEIFLQPKKKPGRGRRIHLATSPTRATRIRPGSHTGGGTLSCSADVLHISVELGQHESRCCCCDCQANSCSDSRTGNSSRCCSSSRRDSRGSSPRTKP